jgi:ribosome biogenesis GTPase A
MDGVGVVEAVAKKRGCIVKGRRGGELDLEKAAMILLTDYRSGKLGRISLESPGQPCRDAGGGPVRACTAGPTLLKGLP